MTILTSKEAAEMLGIGSTQINVLCKKGIIKNAFKDGRRRMIHQIDLDNYMQEKEQEQNEIVGQKFGELTILEVLGYKAETKTKNRLFVLVGCECGEKVELAFYNIERGANVRCSNECITKSGFQIGDKYGHQTILGDAGLRKWGSGRRRRFVQTICDCGTEKEFPLHKLKNGEQNYCGKQCKMKMNDIIGEKYGFLTVLKELERRERRKKDRVFLCKCDCGKEIEKVYDKLISGRTKYCWFDCKIKTGEGNPMWKIDKTPEERLQGRDYWEYNQWRKKVYKRDKFACQCCEKRNGDKNAHHLDGYNWCKEKRTDVTNGITLCEECHENFHKVFGYGDNTKEQFEEWIGGKMIITETECKIIKKEKVSQ